MSSREFLNLIAGLPYESWFKATVREDMDELVGDATVKEQQTVRDKTLALLRGEVTVAGPVEITTDMTEPEHSERRTARHVHRTQYQADPG